MRRTIRLAFLPLAGLGALALAGCGSSDTVTAENESLESVAKKVSESDLRPKAGRWETMVKSDLSNLPAELRAAVAKQQETPTVTCLTPEEAARPNGEFMQGMKDTGCKYDRFTMAGGKLDSVLTCDMGGGSKRTMVSSGTYAPDRYSVTMKSEGSGPGAGPNINMTVTSRLIGECDGSELGAKVK